MALDRQRLLAIFEEELEDRRRDLERGLLALETDTTPERRAEIVAELFRAAHSLKGAAQSVGAVAIADTAHDLEERFAQVRDSGQDVAGQHVQDALAVIDRLDEALGSQPATTASTEAPRASSPAAADVDTTDRPVPRVRRNDPEGLRARVASEDLNGAMSAASQLHVQAAGVAGLTASVKELVRRAQDIERDVRAVRAGSRNDPGRVDVTAVAGSLEAAMHQLTTSALDLERRADARGRQLARAAGEVERAIQQLGLVRFVEVCAGLDRIVRDVATGSGKQARLEVDSGTLELDRTVAAVLRDPLVHLVRNAVDHGLEPPQDRAAAGKQAVGRVAVTAALHAGELSVTVSDDGAGPDVARIRELASRRGLPAGGDDTQVAQLLFTPGFSTRSAAGDVSGRGVGLDVVRTALEAVGGSVGIQLPAQGGMAVQLRLPLTLSTVRAVVVRVAGEVVAFPAVSVERAQRLMVDAVSEVDDGQVIVVDDRSVRLGDLGEVLGFRPRADAAGAGFVLVLRTADGEAAVTVDAVLGEQEVWVRPVPGRLRSHPGLLGGAQLGDGRCVLLLGASTWVRAVHRRGSSVTTRPPPDERPARILLAEDTATTRMLEQSILEAAGYQVLAAVDGEQAWQLLNDDGADLVVTDVDMPRTNGFELCHRIRSSPRFHQVPVVLVTSLADEKDRARGLEVGANAYFVKSGFDQTSLLDTVARLL